MTRAAPRTGWAALAGWAALVGVGAPGCGGDDLPPPPPVVTAGPVTLDTATLTLTVASDPALVQAGFLSIGTVDRLDPSHYYDPRDPGEVAWHTPARATGLDGDWLVLDDDSRVRLTAGGDPRRAVLEVDAGPVDRAVLVRVTLPRAADEGIYGLGDNPLAPDAAGQVREMQFRIDLDSESSLNEVHVPVPLALWPRRGAGALVADDRPGAYDVGAAPPAEVRATFTRPELGPYRAHLFTADASAPLDLVRTYVDLTSRPAVPPRWAFAPQQWRNEHRSRDEVLDDAAQMRALGLPATLMWIDNPWQTGYNTFAFDETRFVDPEGMLATLTAQGYRVQVWSTPYVNTTGPTAGDYDEARSRGLLVTDDTGAPMVFPWQDGPGALVDFTAPGATAWWQERIARVRALGVVGFKLDFGEDLVPDLGGTIVPFHLAAGDNTTYHRRYARGYHQAYLDTFAPGEGVLLTRAGAWGEQDVNPSIWPGDLDSDFGRYGTDDGGERNVGGLPTAIARGLSLSVSGYPFYGSDIGGFREGLPTTEVLARWIEYAALGTIMQLGGGGPSHNPWDTSLFGPEALPIYRQYARLHMDLNPLLWSLAVAAGADGTPVTRPAGFVHDCACDDTMFLLGDDLLVAPVVEAGATTREVVLPAGVWFDWWTGERVVGDGTSARTVAAPLDRLPLWQRAGSLVPMFALPADTLVPATAPGVTSYSDPALGRELRLRYAPGSGPAGAAVALHDGTRAAADGPVVSVSAGSEYQVITLDVDARGLIAPPFDAPGGVTVDQVAVPAVADDAALFACPAPGCWRWDAAARRLQARVFAGTQTRIEITP